jgi:hypothetical protein
MGRTRRVHAADWRLFVRSSMRPRQWRQHVNHELTSSYWAEHLGQRVYLITNEEGTRTAWMASTYVRLLAMRQAPTWKRRRRA